MIPANSIVLLVAVIVSLLLCSIGFKQFVWFMSIGYGLSAAGIGLAVLIMSFVLGANPSIVFVIQCVLLVVYGIRLGGFLLVRQLKNEAYRKKLDQVGGNAAPPIFVSVFMWLFCGLIYVCQSAGAVYRLGNENMADKVSALLIVGVIISAAGVIIEALADKQKNDQKKINPNLPAMSGLYKMCRCPNYFGEMLFWLGIFITGIEVFQGVGQWIVALLGFIEIEFVMISGAKRVEGRHIKNYGTLPEYNKYADSVPLLFPLIPLYHMTSPEKMKAEEAKKAAKKAAKAKK